MIHYIMNKNSKMLKTQIKNRNLFNSVCIKQMIVEQILYKILVKH